MKHLKKLIVLAILISPFFIYRHINRVDKYGFYNYGKLKGINSITNTKYTEDGYDYRGFAKNGFSRYGYHRDTNRKYDIDGFDIDGFDEKGFDKNRIHKETGTRFNQWGYDYQSRDKDGFDYGGYDIDGYDINGADEYGYDRDKNFIGIPFTSYHIPKEEYDDYRADDYIKVDVEYLGDSMVKLKFSYVEDDYIYKTTTIEEDIKPTSLGIYTGVYKGDKFKIDFHKKTLRIWRYNFNRESTKV